ncbi:5-oxoprolinase subunit B family protein [Fimbriiglobus ruber]|uniref:Allophanate hydrolase 2 subunit 1 n=1 Tax=Fimbriiglobus ruber TaxID=1908690 RepID=A0A225D8I8_9BACT|nr:allophanate hydrolase subunit 1 [Fimbriiglobus ruber]OWK37871.1 Allophanate hydrolase 2 subunit 1 [Fimbriiglobus ruber]
MKLTPLGDQAVLAYLSDEAAAVRFAAAVRAAAAPWITDVVPAYASVGVYFDADHIRPRDVVTYLTGLGTVESDTQPAADGPAVHVIPVCYEMHLDLPRVAGQTGLTAEQVIALHTGAEYTVYAIGFVPGFPYLGYLPEPLQGVGRLPSPRVRVEPGSVGLTGRQTGVYPLPRPGGWNIVGRTPLTLVDVAAGYFPLRVGDTVRFARIDAAEFGRLDGERLA